MNGLKDAAKSALRVWVFTTIGLWLPGLLGWVHDVSSWASQKGAPAFPDPSNLAFLFVAALTAGFPAAVAGVWRYAENLWGQSFPPRAAGPGTVNVDGRHERGESALTLIIVVLAVILVVWAVAR